MTEFTRIENPYIIGNPVRGGQPFFGRESDFAYAEQRLRTEREGIVLVFVGGRRSGKTSIMFQILDGRLGDDFLPVFIDMQALSGIHGDAELLGRMARTVIEAIGDERLVIDYYDFTQGSPVLTFDSLLADVAKAFPEKRLLLLIDEAELLRDKVSREEISSSVLTFMASALESRRVSFFFTGSPGLAEAETPEWKRLLGKGDMQEISFLSPADTMRLTREPVAGQVTYADGVVESIYQLSYGQPFYTQLICTTAIDHLNTEQRNHLTREDLDQVVRTIVNSPPPQLLYDWEQFDHNEQLSLSLLSEVSQVAHEPVRTEALLQSIESNEYPIDLSAGDLHMVLDGLDSKMVVQRSDDGGYHFLVDLVRLWIRRSRSVWLLVEEQDSAPKRPRWLVPAVVAGLVAVVALVVGLGMGGGEDPSAPPAAVEPLTGHFAIEFPAGSQVEVRGPLDGQGEPDVLTTQTPDLVQGRRPGRYEISATHPLYSTWVETIDVAAGRNPGVSRDALARLQGRLTVAPAQPGARVRIHNETEQIDTAAVGAIRDLVLNTGPYDIEVSLAGHRPQALGQQIVADSSHVLAPVLDADVGDLWVSSDPPGARLWIGDSEWGATPKTVPKLAARSHKVRLERQGYSAVETTAVVAYARTESLRVPLRLLPGILEIDSTPGRARIWLNGVSLGDTLTPANIQRPPGEYRIRLELFGYDTEEIVQVVAPGQVHTVDPALVQQFGTLKIVRPAVGHLIINGVVDQREGSLQPRRLAVGTYTVGLVGHEKEHQVHIKKGEILPVSWE